jgi:hypothetical protein
MIGVRKRKRQRITENSYGFLECDPVFPAIFAWPWPDPIQKFTLPLYRAVEDRAIIRFHR